MVNNEFTKDISRALNKQTINSELAPGEKGRRYEPTGGVKAHNERIHRESETIDKYKNLPFTFSKPKTAKKPMVKVCVNCGTHVSVNRNTVGIICANCHKFSKVEEVSIEEG